MSLRVILYHTIVSRSQLMQEVNYRIERLKNIQWMFLAKRPVGALAFKLWN